MIRKSLCRFITWPRDLKRQQSKFNKQTLQHSAKTKSPDEAGLFSLAFKAKKMAERAGFEPAVRLPYGSLAGNWFQPLTHVSARRNMAASGAL